MKKTQTPYLLWLRLPLLVALFWSLCLCCVYAAMGLDFGVASDGPICTAETDPVIMPGLLGSPVRIVLYKTDKILIADYTKFAIKKVSKDEIDAPKVLFDSRLKRNSRKVPQNSTGKPLSVVTRKKKSGRVFYVGNDDQKTVDVYLRRNDKTVLSKRFFKEIEVQALDMELDGPRRRIFLIDGIRNEIRVIDYSGQKIRRFGRYGQLSAPKGLALDVERREVIVTDYGDPKVGIPASIQIFSMKGTHLKSITGAFSRPQGVDVSGNKIFVADAMLGQVLEFDRGTGQMVASHGCFGTSEGHLLLPMDVVVDEVEQMLYVADNRNGRITALSLISKP